MRISNSLYKNLFLVPGWKTKRKLVLFAVDDYGSIRMSSRESYETLENSGIKVGIGRYNRYDTIESNSDLDLLFEVLTKHKDINGNHPVFTPLVCVANPDFEKIREANYKEYFYEPFTATLEKYPEHNRVYELWKLGIDRRLFMPQFHSREHLNVTRWMNDLGSGVKSTHLAFEQGVTGIGTAAAPDIEKDYQAAFDIDSQNDLKKLGEILTDGLNLFKKLTGYGANYFTPANGLFNHKLDEVLNKHGVDLINTGKLEIEPLGNGKFRKTFHYLGQKNEFGQRFIQRNALFEPSEPSNFNWVERCIHDIEVAFRWRKPAIVSSHRVNFSGHLVPENRSRGLRALDELFVRIIKKWPDVEFISMRCLNELIK